MAGSDTGRQDNEQRHLRLTGNCAGCGMLDWAADIALLHTFSVAAHDSQFVAELGLVLVGSILFWRWILGILRRQAAEVQQHEEQLKALHEARV